MLYNRSTANRIIGVQTLADDLLDRFSSRVRKQLAARVYRYSANH